MAIPESYAISSNLLQGECRDCGIALVCSLFALGDESSFEFIEAECSMFKISVNLMQIDVCLVYHYPEGSVLTFSEDLENVTEKTYIIK